MHSNVEPAGAVKLNDAVVALVAPAGPPVIVVSGATVSTVNVRVAGVGSVLPEFRGRYRGADRTPAPTADVRAASEGGATGSSASRDFPFAKRLS